jgi:hypothetical protein
LFAASVALWVVSWLASSVCCAACYRALGACCGDFFESAGSDSSGRARAGGGRFRLREVAGAEPGRRVERRLASRRCPKWRPQRRVRVSPWSIS